MSPAKRRVTFLGTDQLALTMDDNTVTSGSLNDTVLVRSVITETMKNCGLSRVLIAEEMSRLSGTTVTERQLNNFAADSRNEYRFPSELERAFCEATGDWKLLTCRVELTGLLLVDQKGVDLMDLGREYLRQKRASAALAGLEAKLSGVQL